jgi:hypothetical protein
MKRSVSLELGEKKYTFITSDPQELVDQVFSKITEMYDSLKKNEEEIGYEMLRLKAKYEEVLSEYFQGRDEVEK